MRHLDRALAARLFFLAASAALFAGCVSTYGSSHERPALLGDATAMYLAGEYEGSVRAYTDFLGSQTSPALMAEGYLGRGNAYYKTGRYLLAEADYRNAERLARDNSIRAEATLGLAHTLFATERYSAAQKVYAKVLRSYEGLVAMDETTYRVGLAQARQGKWDEARRNLEKVKKRWPAGEFARRSDAKLPAVMSRKFTVQVGAFTNRQLAAAKVQELKDRGLAGTIFEIDLGGVPGYAVRSGGFTTWAAAGRHAELLERQGFETYRLP